MSAKEMFKKWGYKQIKSLYHGKLDEISYEADKYATCIRFRLFNKSYQTYYKDEEGNENVANVDMQLNKAIQQQIKELGWESDK